MVEPQPSKLMVRVRFPSPAPLISSGFLRVRQDVGLLLPPWRTAQVHAHVAQSVEHFLGKEEVTGSIPVMSTISRGCRRSLRAYGRFSFFH